MTKFIDGPPPERAPIMRRFFHNPKLDNDKPGSYSGGGPVVPALESEANLIGSAIEGQGDDVYEFHLPVLDIDFDARLVPSSTPGHHHLYLDGMRPLSWDRYRTLLHALAEAGVIDARYYFASIKRGQTLVRKPGVTKPVAVDEEKF